MKGVDGFADNIGRAGDAEELPIKSIQRRLRERTFGVFFRLQRELVAASTGRRRQTVSVATPAELQVGSLATGGIVGDIKDDMPDLDRGEFVKRDAERLAAQTVRAVRGDQVTGPDVRRFATTIANECVNSKAVVDKGVQRSVKQHLDAGEAA